MKREKLVIKVVPKQIFDKKLIQWENEWNQVVQTISCSQDKTLWLGKVGVIQQVMNELSECVVDDKPTYYALDKLANKLSEFELAVEQEQGVAVKERQNEKIIFNQGMLVGIRQMRFFVLALKYPIGSPKHKK